MTIKNNVCSPFHIFFISAIARVKDTQSTLILIIYTCPFPKAVVFSARSLSIVFIICYCYCQGTPAAVLMWANICMSALNKGSSSDPGMRSAVSGIYIRDHRSYYLWIVILLAQLLMCWVSRFLVIPLQLSLNIQICSTYSICSLSLIFIICFPSLVVNVYYFDVNIDNFLCYPHRFLSHSITLALHPSYSLVVSYRLLVGPYERLLAHFHSLHCSLLLVYSWGLGSV
jgi:hypothetical protein